MHIFEDLFEKEQLFTSQVRFDFYHIGFLHLFFFFLPFFQKLTKLFLISDSNFTRCLQKRNTWKRDT